VLQNPIVGEAARFDGTVAPAGWMFAQGQVLRIADYPKLYAVLRRSAGGDGKTTFALPRPKQSWIIAVTGVSPNSPAMLASLRKGLKMPNGIPGSQRVARIIPPPLDDGHPNWWPGTMPTPEFLAEQERQQHLTRPSAIGSMKQFIRP
jgi:hypothetical protein